MRRILAVLTIAAALAWPGAVRQALASADYADLAFQPHPGASLPLGAALQDESGRAVRLGDFFAETPVVLLLDYLHCKTLCGLTLENLLDALTQLPLTAGRDYQLIALSIDPRDGPADAAAARAKYWAEHHRAGMHFLTGAEPAVRRVAEAIGFPYRYDAALDQYIHPAGFIIASPSGRISRYVLGLDAGPAQLQAALADAAASRSAGPLTRLLLFCHIEGNGLSRYTAPVLAALTLANLAGLAAAILLFVAIMRRRHS